MAWPASRMRAKARAGEALLHYPKARLHNALYVGSRRAPRRKRRPPRGNPTRTPSPRRRARRKRRRLRRTPPRQSTGPAPPGRAPLPSSFLGESSLFKFFLGIAFVGINRRSSAVAARHAHTHTAPHSAPARPPAPPRLEGDGEMEQPEERRRQTRMGGVEEPAANEEPEIEGKFLINLPLLTNI